jgi:hypothetical protein
MVEFRRFSEHLIQDGFTYSYAVSAADFTGTGSLDLVVADAHVGLHLLENDGNGNFTPHLIHRRGGEWLERHILVDLDGDGRREIIAADNINGCLVCFEYDGDPREASSWRNYYISEGELPGAYDVTAADLDGDGEMEIAASGWRIGNQFCCFKRRKGHWERQMVDENLPETRAVAVADFDGDGRLDLLGTVCVGNQVVWYENCGTSSGLQWRKHLIDETDRPYHGHPADMNGNGNTDVVMALQGPQDPGLDGSIVWYENEGSGATWQKHLIGAFPGAFEAVAGDMDGDGFLEVVASSVGEARLALFKHEGDPRGPWQMQVLKENWTGVTQPILADLDGDGRLDLAACAASGGNELRWWKNEGPA